jgi:dipeptidyl aminopeptidase/acylaminoacyl peptidase
MNADGTGSAEVPNQGIGTNSNPRWSPDGRKLAFQSNRDGHCEVYIITLNNGSVVRLTNSTANSWTPAWSPDGTKLTYVTWAEVYLDAVYVMNADGSNQYRLTDFSHNEVPTWSPDGTQIVFSTMREGGGRQIYIMNGDGSNQHRLTNGSGDNLWPVWSPSTSFEHQVMVDARIEWQDTGIDVMEGDWVQVTYLSGVWTIWKGVDPYTDANGQVGRMGTCAILPSANIGGLVGRVDASAPQFIGNDEAFFAHRSGHLQLSINDCLGHFSDNDGIITVKVSIIPAP